MQQNRAKEGSVCFLMLKASIASSPLHSTSHPSITEWERGTDSIAWSQQSSRASSRKRERERQKERKWETPNKGSGDGRKAESGVERNTERRSKRAWERRICYPEKLSSPLVILHHPACVFSIPVTSFMAFWLCDPRVGCHFSALPCHSAPSSHAAHTGGSSVVSGAWTSHHCCKTEQILWRTKCDSWAADLWSRDDRHKPAACAATPIHTWLLLTYKITHMDELHMNVCTFPFNM